MGHSKVFPSYMDCLLTYQRIVYLYKKKIIIIYLLKIDLMPPITQQQEQEIYQKSKGENSTKNANKKNKFLTMFNQLHG